jgi:hypothetical protein
MGQIVLDVDISTVAPCQRNIMDITITEQKLFIITSRVRLFAQPLDKPDSGLR